MPFREASPVGFLGEMLAHTAERGGRSTVCLLPPEEGSALRKEVASLSGLWTWGFEACGHMSALGTEDLERVWAVLVEAVTGGGEPGRSG